VLKPTLLLVISAGAGLAEVHSLTLREAVNIALKENPDLVLARLDEQKAQAAIRVARDPFVPKVYAGSGLAKVWGYPTSIEGAAPAIIQSRTDMALFNRPKSYELARVRETARGAAINTQSKLPIARAGTRKLGARERRSESARAGRPGITARKQTSRGGYGAREAALRRAP
jgi:outer membrane protein TolC